MPSTTGCRTVVLGAGLAGSVAAVVCARAGHDVLLVERDATTDGIRPGAAHGRQLHNLLGRAQRHLAELIPGFEQQFTKWGGQRARIASQTHVFELGTRMPERDLGLEIWSSRRSVVDRIVGHAVAESGVRVRFGGQADGLVIASGRVTAVRTGDQLIEADLVIDAMGAKSPVTRFLNDKPPPVDEHVVRQWYATMSVRRPASGFDASDFWLTFPTFPRTRGGLVSPVDESTWNVSLSGGPTDPPPRTAAEFLAYARTLEQPDVATVIAAGRAEVAPNTFRKPRATWRRYDAAPWHPMGLVSVGDAVADLNPLLGQGISVAAWQLAALATLIDSAVDVDDLTVRLRSAAADAVRAAWLLSTLYEPGVGDTTPSDEELSRIVRAVEVDPVAHRRYVEVWHLLRPAAHLRDIAAGRTPVDQEEATA